MKIQTNWVGGCPLQPQKPEPMRARGSPVKARRITGPCVIVDSAQYLREYEKKYGATRIRRPLSRMYDLFVPGKTLEIVCDLDDTNNMAANAYKWAQRRRLSVIVTQQVTATDGRGRVYLSEKARAV